MSGWGGRRNPNGGCVTAAFALVAVSLVAAACCLAAGLAVLL